MLSPFARVFCTLSWSVHSHYYYRTNEKCACVAHLWTKPLRFCPPGSVVPSLAGWWSRPYLGEAGVTSVFPTSLYLSLLLSLSFYLCIPSSRSISPSLSLIRYFFGPLKVFKQWAAVTSLGNKGDECGVTRTLWRGPAADQPLSPWPPLCGRIIEWQLIWAIRGGPGCGLNCDRSMKSKQTI